MARTKKTLSTSALETQSSRVYDALVNPGRRNYRAWKQMLREDSVTGIANKSLTILITSMIGEYQSANERFMECVNESLDQMVGTPQDLWQGCTSSAPYGFAIAPIKYRYTGGKYYLDQLLFLPVEDVIFKIESNQVIGFTALGKDFPYYSKLHLINEPYLSPGVQDPRGVPLCLRAFPAWEAHKQNELVRSFVIKKQGAKLLVGKTDTDDRTEYDEQGNATTYNEGDDMRETLIQAETTDVVVVHREDEVDVVDWTTKGEIFNDQNYLAQVERFRAFYHPQTIFGGNKSGVGDAGLAKEQASTVLNFAEEMAAYITTSMVEQGYRPMLEQNYGYSKEGYGEHALNRPNSQSLEIAGLIGEMLRSGLTEKEYYDRFNELTGVVAEVTDDWGQKKEPKTDTKKNAKKNA